MLHFTLKKLSAPNTENWKNYHFLTILCNKLPKKCILSLFPICWFLYSFIL